ncbi:MAG: surface lipoprotein assembly modifier [Neptuniibacter sp.]
MLLKKLSQIVALLLFITLPVKAEVKQLNELVQQQKFADAYALANQMIDEYEGIPEFDLHYAVAAIETGNYSEGMFALERILLVDPNNYQAQLELARGYYLMGQHERSKLLFQSVLATNPPAKVQQRINYFLALIDEKTTVAQTIYKSFIELNVGHDSNINSAPDDQLTVVTLSQDALEQSDNYSQFRYYGKVRHRYQKDRELFVDLNANSRFYASEDQQNFDNFALSAGHLWLTGKGYFSVSANAQKYRIDNDQYRNLAGVRAAWSRQLSKQSVVKAYAALNKLTYETNTWKDSKLSSLGITYLYGASGNWQPLYFLSVFVGSESPDEHGVLSNAEVDRDIYGGNLGVQVKPLSSLLMTGSLTYQASDFEGNDWIYGIARKDDYLSASLSAEWQFAQSWTLLGSYRYADVDSNIELYEYNRQQVQLGLRYSFQ